MPVRASAISIERDAPVSTWMNVGGRADALARPAGAEELRALLEWEGPVRILGDGANLLVADEGVDGLVISLEKLKGVEDLGAPGLLRVQAGANLPRLVVEAARRGLSGLEGLAGVPATLGGAVRMNAGGAFGAIADAVTRVHSLTRSGEARTLERDEIDFGYRRSGLEDLIITSADLALTQDEPEDVRSRTKEVMAKKKASQPLAADSAGCVFRNPLVEGERVSAGMLLDRAGCKGLRSGGAHVSDRHANFVCCDAGATARDVTDLIDLMRTRVRDAHGVDLETEIVIWRREDAS
jgi:UDP-N-acetylmuramate dehydrogenase